MLDVIGMHAVNAPTLKHRNLRIYMSVHSKRSGSRNPEQRLYMYEGMHQYPMQVCRPCQLSKPTSSYLADLQKSRALETLVLLLQCLFVADESDFDVFSPADF